MIHQGMEIIGGKKTELIPIKEENREKIGSGLTNGYFADTLKC